eukprot:15461296-Alexandrium_andersonii.AAC.1
MARRARFQAADPRRKGVEAGRGPSKPDLRQPPEVGVRVGGKQLNHSSLLEDPSPDCKVPLEVGMP